MTMLCSLVGCSSAVLACQNKNILSEGFISLSVEEFAKAIEDPGIVRLDVRTAEEYSDGHIANTLNIDVLKDDFESNVLKTIPKTSDVSGKPTTVAVNCRSGKRSKTAAKILVKNGYKVIELDSGYIGWVNKGMPVSK